jgi:hypothetical protein
MWSIGLCRVAVMKQQGSLSSVASTSFASQHNPENLFPFCNWPCGEHLDQQLLCSILFCRRMEAGRRGPYLDLMVVELERLGYSRLGIRRWRGAADSFIQWLASEGLRLADITESVADRYCGSFPGRRYNKWLERNARQVRDVIEFLLRRQGSAGTS